MAFFTHGNYNCACSREFCDWTCTTYLTMMSYPVPNTASQPFKSNADRIRAMTDEELAEFMCHNVSNGTVNCAFCAAAEFCRMGHNGWLDWLKEEAKGDTDEDKA